jgi:hypothetical protein
MMDYYFGHGGDYNGESIYVEIQWTAWLLDGGIPLILAYCAALLTTSFVSWRVARQTPTANREDLWVWGALLLAYNVAIVALTFSYTPFMGQVGLEFWLLNGVLFSVARTSYPALLTVRRVKR